MARFDRGAQPSEGQGDLPEVRLVLTGQDSEGGFVQQAGGILALWHA